MAASVTNGLWDVSDIVELLQTGRVRNSAWAKRDNLMLRLFMLACILVCAPMFALAQTTDAGYADALSPSLASVSKIMHATIRRNLAEAAEVMSSEDYVFRPTPQVRTFGQLVGHVIDANVFFCSQATARRHA